MLDIFLTTFLTAGFLFVVRHRTRADPSSGERLAGWFGSRDLFLAGAMFGAAVATKWAGLFGLTFGLVLVAVWRTTATPDRNGGGLTRLRPVAVWLVAVPVLSTC
jgi:dolichyl-phosphate-mannose--protein O-mannosyl transferase